MAKFKLKGPDGGTYVVTAETPEMAHSALYGAAPAPQEGSIVGEAAKGALEGTASIADTPLNLVRFADRVIQHARGQEPHQINYPDSPLMGRARGTDFAGAARKTLGEPAPGYETTRNVAGAVAPIAVTLGTEGLLSSGLRGAATGVAKAVPVTAGVHAGSAVGGAAGEAVGGNVGRDIGEMAGNVLGAGGVDVAGNMARRAPRVFLNGNSTDVAAAANNLKVPLSFGLVGNKLAQWLEDITTTPQMGGGAAARTRLEQHNAMGAAAEDAASALRGYSREAPVDVESVGNSVLDAARKANAGYDFSQRFVQDALERRVGEGSVADISPIVDYVQGRPGLRASGEFGEPAPVPLMQRNTELAARRDTLNPVMSSLLDERNLTPIDPALDASLRHMEASTRNSLTDTIEGQPLGGRHERQHAPDPVTGIPGERGMGRRAAAAIDPLSRGRLESQLVDLQAQIERNMGMPYGALKDWRTDLGRKMEGMDALHPDYEAKLYELATQSMRDTAIRQGVPGTRFDAAQRLTRGFHQQEGAPAGTPGPMKLVEPVAKMAEPKDAYSAAFGGQIPSVTLLDAMARRARPQTEAAMADWMEQKIRGNTDVTANEAEIHANPTGMFNRVRADNFMQGLSEGMKQRLSGSDREAAPANRQRLDDMQTVYQAERSRPTRSLPQGGTSITAPGIFTAITGGMLDNVVTPILSASGLGRYMTNEANVRAALGNPTPYADSFKSGVMNAAPAIIPRPQDQQ